jgi:hypothetical protein
MKVYLKPVRGIGQGVEALLTTIPLRQGLRTGCRQSRLQVAYDHPRQRLARMYRLDDMNLLMNL